TSQRTALDGLFASPEQVEVLMGCLENALCGNVTRGSIEEKTLREFGQAAFDAIFRTSESISALYTKSAAAAKERLGLVAGLRVRLNVEAPDLAQFPWEYIYNKSSRDWLSLL